MSEAPARRDRSFRFEDKMSDAEALMWNVEKDPWLNPNGAMVTILDKPLDMDAFRRRLEVAVAEVPRLRERVVPGFGRMSPPTWSVDAEFDFDYHVRHISLPAPGTMRQLLDLATRFYEDPYDRTRPLWMFVAIDGLEGGKGAVFSKMHHAVTDGIGAIRLSERYIETSADAPAPEPVDLRAIIAEAAAQAEGEGPDEPGVRSALDSLLSSAGHAWRRQAGIARRAVGEVASWTGDPLQAKDLADDLVGNARTLLDQMGPSSGDGPAGGSPLWKQRSRRRHLEALRVPLDDLKAAGKALGGSVNDMFVAGTLLGAIEYHARRDTVVEAFNISFVVSTRKDSDIGGNAFTPTLLQVPTGPETPEDVLHQVRDLMAERRAAVSDEPGLSGLAGVANLLPTSVVTQMGRAQAARMDFATSNLRGAWFPTYMSGSEVLQNIVMGPVAGTACNITTMSYNGNLDIGVFCDPAAIEDPADFRDCLEQAYDQLIEAGGIVATGEGDEGG